MNNIALENVGLILGVTPRISPDGMVVMEIDAEKSEVGPESDGIPVSVSTDGTIIRSPRIDTTTAQTTVERGKRPDDRAGRTDHARAFDSRPPRAVPVEHSGAGKPVPLRQPDQPRRELLIIMTPHVIRNAQDAERIKQIEASRMSWCTADVHALHGVDGLCTSGDCPICNAQTPVLYPDLSPRGLTPDTMPAGEVIPGSSPGERYLPPDANSRPPAELPAPGSTLSVRPTGVQPTAFAPVATSTGPVALPHVRDESPARSAAPPSGPIATAAQAPLPTPPPGSAKRNNWFDLFKSKR